MDEKSQKYQIPLLGKDQFDQPLVQLNMSYKDAFPKVLNAMSALDVGSYDEELKTIYSPTLVMCVQLKKLGLNLVEC